MDPLNITVISCLYGQTHVRFLEDWVEAVGRLNPAPARIILTTDHDRFIPPVHVYCYRNHDWQYPQAFYLNKALEWVDTDWVWVVDIDDLAYPDALDGIDVGDADVFQMGYVRSDGEEHLPSAIDLLRLDYRNGFVAGSMVRTEALSKVGGFRDVALQDWDLWRRLADSGTFFAFSDRPRFQYRRHEETRGVRELVLDRRAHHVAEMEAA